MTNFKKIKFILILIASLSFSQFGFSFDGVLGEQTRDVFGKTAYIKKEQDIENVIENLLDAEKSQCKQELDPFGLSSSLPETASEGWCAEADRRKEMERYCSCVNKLLVSKNVSPEEQEILDSIENRSYSMLTDLRRKRKQFYEISALTGIQQLYGEGLDGKTFKEDTCFSQHLDADKDAEILGVVDAIETSSHKFLSGVFSPNAEGFVKKDSDAIKKIMVDFAPKLKEFFDEEVITLTSARISDGAELSEGTRNDFRNIVLKRIENKNLLSSFFLKHRVEIADKFASPENASPVTALLNELGNDHGNHVRMSKILGQVFRKVVKDHNIFTHNDGVASAAKSIDDFTFAEMQELLSGPTNKCVQLTRALKSDIAGIALDTDNGEGSFNDIMLDIETGLNSENRNSVFFNEMRAVALRPQLLNEILREYVEKGLLDHASDPENISHVKIRIEELMGKKQCAAREGKLGLTGDEVEARMKELAESSPRIREQVLQKGIEYKNTLAQIQILEGELTDLSSLLGSNKSFLIEYANEKKIFPEPITSLDPEQAGLIYNHAQINDSGNEDIGKIALSYADDISRLGEIEGRLQEKVAKLNNIKSDMRKVLANNEEMSNSTLAMLSQTRIEDMASMFKAAAEQSISYQEIQSVNFMASQINLEHAMSSRGIVDYNLRGIRSKPHFFSGKFNPTPAGFVRGSDLTLNGLGTIDNDISLTGVRGISPVHNPVDDVINGVRIRSQVLADTVGTSLDTIFRDTTSLDLSLVNIDAGKDSETAAVVTGTAGSEVLEGDTLNEATEAGKSTLLAGVVSGLFSTDTQVQAEHFNSAEYETKEDVIAEKVNNNKIAMEKAGFDEQEIFKRTPEEDGLELFKLIRNPKTKKQNLALRSLVDDDFKREQSRNIMNEVASLDRNFVQKELESIRPAQESDQSNIDSNTIPQRRSVTDRLRQPRVARQENLARRTENFFNSVGEGPLVTPKVKPQIEVPEVVDTNETTQTEITRGPASISNGSKKDIPQKDDTEFQQLLASVNQSIEQEKEKLAENTAQLEQERDLRERVEAQNNLEVSPKVIEQAPVIDNSGANYASAPTEQRNVSNNVQATSNTVTSAPTRSVSIPSPSDFIQEQRTYSNNDDYYPQAELPKRLTNSDLALSKMQVSGEENIVATTELVLDVVGTANEISSAQFLELSNSGTLPEGFNGDYPLVVKTDDGRALVRPKFVEGKVRSYTLIKEVSQEELERYLLSEHKLVEQDRARQIHYNHLKAMLPN
jgi:hypothetical protein